MAQKESIEAKEAREALKKKRNIKTGGPKKVVDPWIKEFIKSHAKTSPREIYGWLIGRESNNGDIYVFSAMACQRYVKQNFIGAAPDPREIQELGSNIPQGLGMVGIYHSHPAEIFHSSVDDRTLQNMARMYPQMLSAVTNADEFDDPKLNETRWFQLDGDGKSTNEIAVQFQEIPRNKFLVVAVYGSLEFDVEVPKKGKIAQQVVRVLMNNYETIWETGELKVWKLSEKRKKKIDPWAVKSIEETFSEFNSKELETIRTEEIDPGNKNHLEYFLDRSFVIKLNMSLNSAASAAEEKNSSKGQIRVKGKIPLLAVNVFDKGEKDLGVPLILDKIKSEFKDDFIQKLSRSLMTIEKIDGNSLKYFLKTHVSSPVFLPYPGIPLKVNVFVTDTSKLQESLKQSITENLGKIPDLKENSLQSGTQFVEMETEILKSLSKRASVLASGGYLGIALSLAKTIKVIFEKRGQSKQVQRMDTLINLVENM